MREGIIQSPGVGSGTNMGIRGMISTTVGANSTAAVQAHINGMQVNQSVFTTIGFFDVSQIEILEGGNVVVSLAERSLGRVASSDVIFWLSDVSFCFTLCSSPVAVCSSTGVVSSSTGALSSSTTGLVSSFS